MKIHKESYKKKQLNARLKYEYSLTLLEYEEILLKQNGVCAICGKRNKGGNLLSVDHNHTSGKVRGLLCTKCNTAIGLLNEDKALFILALLYLNNYE